MDANVIVSMVGSLGFPICVAIYMIYVNQKQAEKHADETTKMTEAINDLKLVIQSLIDKLGE